MNPTLIILLTGLGLFLMIVLLLSSTVKHITKHKKQEEIQREQIRVNNQVNLTNLEIKVLDLYEQSGIQLPTEVIENVSHMNLTNEKDILNYIESQRNYWKLENSKKLFRRS